MLPSIKGLIQLQSKNICNFTSICKVTQTSIPSTTYFITSRCKSKGPKQKQESSGTETESEEKDFLDDVQDKNIKTMKVNVNSLRLDGIIKSGLGISRNKIETIFYESKIRLNGQKVVKKSVNVKEGDEIDVIKGVSMQNPKFLMVARVEVVSAADKGDSINVKLRRNKSLLVDNYKEPWKP